MEKRQNTLVAQTEGFWYQVPISLEQSLKNHRSSKVSKGHTKLYGILVCSGRHG